MIHDGDCHWQCILKLEVALMRSLENMFQSYTYAEVISTTEQYCLTVEFRSHVLLVTGYYCQCTICSKRRVRRVKVTVKTLLKSSKLFRTS